MNERARGDRWDDDDDAFFNLPFNVEKSFIRWNKAEYFGWGNVIDEVLRWRRGKHRKVRREASHEASG